MSAPQPLVGAGGRPSPKNAWRTPPGLFARLDDEFGFALDAACDRGNCLAAIGIFGNEGQDALTTDWMALSGGGATWCNPPYSRLRPWVEKGRDEGRGSVVVMLIPADTSTRWWREVVAVDATEIRFLTGRPRLLLPGGESYKTPNGSGVLPMPSVVVVFTPRGGPPAYSYIDARPSKQPALPLAVAAPAALPAGEREEPANG